MNVGLTVIVKALAPELKTIPSTSVVAERDTPVVFERANVAVSAGPLGTVMGVQFVAVCQSPLPGLRFQVALAAWLALSTEQQDRREQAGAEYEFFGCFHTMSVLF